MSDKYILDGKVAVPCEDLMTWGKWFENAKRTVAKDEIENPNDLTDKSTMISTIFLGLDHSFGGGEPLLFETMVFGGVLDGEQERCTTWEQAEQMHADMVKRVKDATPQKNYFRYVS